MKKIMFVLAFMMATAICAEGHRHYIRPVTISVQTFYDDLSPYGEWISTPGYGFVWRPYLDDPSDFRPYATNGNWVYTDLGWTWVSGYPWGWATFHYGRWTYDDYLGWTWIPGNEWAPAWVEWGSYNNCWAWAPMGPSIMVNVSPVWLPPFSWWTFVPCDRFYSDNWYSYIYTQPVQVNHITCITNIYQYGDNDRRYHHEGWYHGPRVSDVERHLNTRVRKMEVVDAGKPNGRVTRNDRVAVYRPEVKADRKEDQPREFRTTENIRANTVPVRRNGRPADRSVKRSGETGVAPGTSGTVVRNDISSRFNYTPAGNPGASGRNTRISREPNPSPAPARIEHAAPARENVGNAGNRNTGPSQRVNDDRRQPAQTRVTTSQVRQQPASPDRNRGRVEQKNEAGNNRAVPKTPSRVSSSTTRNR